MTNEVVTIGETMVVFDPVTNGPLRYIDQFKKRIAGAESNVAIGLAKLGIEAGWISRVSDDEIGHYVVNAIRGEGVDTSGVSYDVDSPTGLYIKERLREGNNQVYYYRQQSAASRLTTDHIPWATLKEARFVHLTGITPFLSESCLDVVHAIIKFCKINQIFVSFDPNMRLKIMKLFGMEEAKKILLSLARQSDIVMLGLEEAEQLLGTKEYVEIADFFFGHDVKYVVVKNGAHETYYATNHGESGKIPSFHVNRVIDPIGAGDGFSSGVLAGLVEGKSLKDAVKLGAAVGAMVITVEGDIEGLPDRKSLESFIQKDHLDVIR